jgi:Hydrazine synthase alpha subunit middle domain
MNLRRTILGVLAGVWLTASGGASVSRAEPVTLDLTAERQREYQTLQRDLTNRTRFEKLTAQTFHPAALLEPTDCDPLDIVLRRTEVLLADLRRKADTTNLWSLAESLAELKHTANAAPVADAAARRCLFEAACALRRRVAFSNPLLDFQELLFVKRHRALLDHMCDQYYGIAARPGGGLYVLEGLWGPEPRLRDLLASSVCAGGRLAGQRLSGGPRRPWDVRYDGMGNLQGEATQGGAFLSPALSYDGRTVLFAYVECQGGRQHRAHTDPNCGHWAEGRCYHLFRIDRDGSGLTQLTDGTWNDFDPCWLPDGRVAFISERRGGYLRCGRVCPTYTVFDMTADGSDIRCLSFHETNEWDPSVTHDGQIVYTRWDYIDRHGVVAHTPWTMSPDGRDPRAVHGNYAFRSARPDMELSVRAIPGSRRFVATSAPHHGQAFGALVVVDPSVPDDDAMGPVRRLTPDVDFPETQGGVEAYGEAWPLSEDYYLCVYDPAPRLSDAGPKGAYGLYLLDSFGNRELIYRDAEIGCHSPIPLRPRPRPPVVPDRSERVAADQPAEATVGIIDVYRSRQPWPAGTRIKALRVYQVLPLAVASAAVTHNTGLQIPQGNDSVNLARAVLGEAPVEEDGSAYFVVPARRELYFQVLDEQGLAVTSMRSATQFQPGEQATCLGCHEPKFGTPVAGAGSPLALRRPPSRLAPGPEGANPFSYPRLVQPVLDRHCVDCHARESAKAPPLGATLAEHAGRGGMDVATTYYVSYLSLAPKFGFYDYGGRDWNDPKWYRTTPGEFGARGSRLYALLQCGHYGVSLPPEDRRRLTLWLDSCSVFYGVYEKAGGESQLRGEVAHPTLE